MDDVFALEEIKGWLSPSLNVFFFFIQPPFIEVEWKLPTTKLFMFGVIFHIGNHTPSSPDSSESFLIIEGKANFLGLVQRYIWRCDESRRFSVSNTSRQSKSCGCSPLRILEAPSNCIT